MIRIIRFDFHLLESVRPGGGEGVVEDVGKVREVFVWNKGTRMTEWETGEGGEGGGEGSGVMIGRRG